MFLGFNLLHELQLLFKIMYNCVLEVITVCSETVSAIQDKQTIQSSSKLMSAPGNICTLKLTNTPINSVIEFSVQSSVPLSCNCKSSCNNIKVLVPGWPTISICEEITKPEYRFVRNQNPIQIQIQSNVANIGSSFNLTYRGKLTPTKSCRMVGNLFQKFYKRYIPLVSV